MHHPPRSRAELGRAPHGPRAADGSARSLPSLRTHRHPVPISGVRPRVPPISNGPQRARRRPRGPDGDGVACADVELPAAGTRREHLGTARHLDDEPLPVRGPRRSASDRCAGTALFAYVAGGPGDDIAAGSGRHTCAMPATLPGSSSTRPMHEPGPRAASTSPGSSPTSITPSPTLVDWRCGDPGGAHARSPRPAGTSATRCAVGRSTNRPLAFDFEQRLAEHLGAPAARPRNGSGTPPTRPPRPRSAVRAAGTAPCGQPNASQRYGCPGLPTSYAWCVPSPAYEGRA